jgi:4-hydroxy-tetrahydrodipicolinate reductase
MKIAILGYGKMGKIIDQLATSDGHEIVLRIGADNLDDLTPEALRRADVAIEFSVPEAALENIITCLRAGVPVVSGTTAWLDHLDEVLQEVETTSGAFFYAPNFSIGVNIFFALNQYLAQMMNEQEQYEVQMEEIHHTEKKDAPSGTAIKLAEDLLDRLKRKKEWKNELDGLADTLGIVSKREPGVPGTHTISYTSPVDSISITHTAHSREGFARGAIAAAQWLIGKKGYFQMSDMLGF